jgi:hypothetical protein
MFRTQVCGRVRRNFRHTVRCSNTHWLQRITAPRAAVWLTCPVLLPTITIIMLSGSWATWPIPASVKMSVSSVRCLSSTFYWLVFRNSVRETGSLHSAIMLYPFVFVIVDFFWTGRVLSSFMIPWFLLWSNCVFFGFPKKFHLCSCDAAVVLFLPVSLWHSSVGIATVLHIRNPICFWTLEGFRTWLMFPVNL